MSSTEQSALVFSLIWWGLGFVGVLILLAKGYAAVAAKWGCLVWLVFGWVPLLVIPAFGPITLLAALLIKGKKRCPQCKTLIPGDAIRCPQCQADLKQQNSQGKAPLVASPPPAHTAKSKFCMHCGQPVQAGSKFCQHCGKALS
jgi:RNA polymerase subunit RPABC4/transcription elongation factor Spt4